MSNMFALHTMACLMALCIAFTYWFFRQIRAGRIDPRLDPEWGPYRAPASPHPLIDPTTTFGSRPEHDDDHVRYIDE
jgi:hypothetical protein